MRILSFHDHNLISWRSKTIKTVAKSTCDENYSAVSTTARHVGWLRRLYVDLAARQAQNFSLVLEIRGALALAANYNATKRSMYIENKHHLIR